ncbi:uncharacterized protein LOC143362527 [Halictus rubicundus]|uniref:uncharacterized protein LOC143362527 n=1 Tax=Halictus rubicundus TaxID=77578 RepID=UPI0040365189
MSNTLDSYGKECSKPLRDAGTFPFKQSSRSRSRVKENSVGDPSSRKRKRAVMNIDDIVSKRLCKEEDSELHGGLQDESRQDLPDQLCNPCQTNQYRNHFPHRLIGLMYQLDLSVLCSLRKFTYEHKYPSLSLVFGDCEVDKFNNIVLRYKEKSIHIQIENVDKYYISNGISYARLFTKEKLRFSINNYFDSFVKHLIYKSGSLSNNIEYLIVYTNLGLDLTKERELKQGRFRNFHPFKFDSVNIEEHDILKDFLFTNDITNGSAFYKFVQEEITREELLKRLVFSSVVQKVVRERKLSQKFEKKIKEEFLDKLVFAVNQPSREELNSIIKTEIEKNNKVQYNYIALQKEILRDLTTLEKHKKFEKLVNYIPGIMYEFNLLIFFLHNMFLHENISSINSKRKSHDIRNDITIHYKGKTIYVMVHTTDGNIDYNQLFSSRQQNNTFSVNKLFTLFTEELKQDIKYFIIYTNVDLGPTNGKRFRKECIKDYYPLNFYNICVRKKKYKILRDCLCVSENSLYKFAQEERRELLQLLKLPPSLQKEKEEGRLPTKSEREKKEKFLDKLIFVVHQSNKEKLSSIKNEIDNSNKVPYNYEELHEIALRWSESHECGHITKEITKKIFQDIQNNRFSYQKLQNKNINEEIKFAKSVIGREGTPAFDQFLDFLIKEERLEILKRKGIKLATMSGILCGAGANASKAFKSLQDLWFGAEGNKTRYLKTLEKNGINLSTMSSILIKAGVNAPEAFVDLYDLWFDEKGNKKQYLKTLEEEGISLTTMSSMLNGAGAKAPKVFKDLHDLWFDTEGNKKHYLKILEDKGINLANMSSILSGAGANASKSFKDLYDFWFYEEGNKKQYLKTLEEEGINLANMSSILSGAGANAARAFKDLYDLWFDEEVFCIEQELMLLKLLRSYITLFLMNKEVKNNI